MKKVFTEDLFSDQQWTVINHLPTRFNIACFFTEYYKKRSSGAKNNLCSANELPSILLLDYFVSLSYACGDMLALIG